MNISRFDIVNFNINFKQDMKSKHIPFITAIASIAFVGTSLLTSCTAKSSSSSNARTDKDTTIVDIESKDTTLQTMVKEIAPKFKQFTYSVAGKDTKIQYNLYSPESIDLQAKYPLVLFMADASTAGKEVTEPLTQGYGALVWATPKAQEKNPCYVLVPQFSTVATDDEYNHSAEVDDVIGLVNEIIAEYPIDASRVYSTGQSMGGMISMYYDVAYPEMFAASIFVDSHWDSASFPELVKHKFVWFIGGEKGKAFKKLDTLKEAAEKGGVSYTFAEWSAKLPQSQQDDLASTMLQKGAPINIFEFETGSVLPEGVKDGIDHMYCFDYAYKNSAVRDWLFHQHK